MSLHHNKRLRIKDGDDKNDKKDVVEVNQEAHRQEFRVKKLHPEAIIPVKGSGGAAGFDISSVIDVTIESGKREMVSTGLAFEIPHGTYGRMAPRSGLAAKHGIDVLAGVLDEDYRGEIKAILLNTGDKPFEIKKGDRIAQVILEKYLVNVDVVEVSKLEESKRGTNGFGSTGVSEYLNFSPNIPI